MRKHLNEIEEIERFLEGATCPEDMMLFEAKCIVSPELKENTAYQKAVHALAKWFGRQKQKEQFESVFSTLMRDKKFSSQVYSIFR
jgi:hypothetical protein